MRNNGVENAQSASVFYMVYIYIVVMSTKL